MSAKPKNLSADGLVTDMIKKMVGPGKRQCLRTRVGIKKVYKNF
jgi:hypothetical protein